MFYHYESISEPYKEIKLNVIDHACSEIQIALPVSDKI